MHPEEEGLFILIEGDLARPGVYRFPQEATLKDLMARAGGPDLGESSPDLFRDLPLFSGAKVVVQRDGEEWRFFHGEMSGFYKYTLGIPISLNHESEVGLTAIPGIGPGLAKTIVEERSRRKGFRRLDEIMELKGIGTKLFKEISPHLKP